MTELWSDDDLDAALDALHSDVPTDERALTEARAGLLAAAGQPGEGNSMSITHEKTAVRPAEPARRRKPARWLAAAAAIVAVAAGAVVAVETLGPDGDGRRVDGQRVESGAAAVLNRAARNVDPDYQQVGPGQYLYLRRHEWVVVGANDTMMWREEQYMERWVPADHTQIWLERSRTTGKYRWVSGNEQKAKEKGLLPKPRSSEAKARCGDFNPEKGFDRCSYRGWEHPMPDWSASLPRDPAELLARLRAETDSPSGASGTQLDLYALETATQTLSSGLLPADLRAALYKAIALMPQIRITDKQMDLDGRTGTALGVTYDGKTREIIVDRDTGDFLGERSRWQGRTTMRTTSLRTAVVDEMGQRPSK